jgi:hypothetical protein
MVQQLINGLQVLNTFPIVVAVCAARNQHLLCPALGNISMKEALE